MPLISYGLTLYFATTFGVAGLAKLAQPGLFAATLRRQGLFPPRSVDAISHLFPWCEIVLAGALVIGIAPVLTATITLLLFVAFVATHILLFVRSRGEDCGCYGAIALQRAEGASMGTAAVLTCLAAAHLGLARHIPPIGWSYRLCAGALFFACACWLGVRCWQRRQSNARCRVRQRP